MMAPSAKALVTRLLAGCGLAVDGPSPRDPQIRDERVYARVLREGSLGAGEAYTEGWWDAEDLSGCLEAVLRGGLDASLERLLWVERFRALAHRLLNRQTIALSRRVAERHYDLPIPFWRRMLGETMQYSCAYWGRGAGTLDEAQLAKMDLVCEKLQLQEGLTVLETGCGWGSLAHYMAVRYGARVTAFTLSEEQYRFAVAHYSHPNVEFLRRDYREIARERAGQRFDRIASIGIIEHVGRANYDLLFGILEGFLEPHGWAIVHGMGKQTAGDGAADRWTTRYIFPGGEIPRLGDVVDSIARSGLVIEDLHNLAFSYVPTLRAWLRNVLDSWEELGLDPVVYGRRAFRTWVYFLNLSIAAFEARALQLYHFVLSHPGAPKGAIPPAVAGVR